MKLETKRIILYAAFGAAAIVILLVAANGCAGAQTPQTGESFAMDTIVTQTVYSDDPNVLPAVDAVIADAEQLFSKTLAGSDVYALNHAGGADVSIAPQTAGLLSMCVSEARKTGGAYNPALGGVIDAWAFGTDDAHVPPADELAARLKNTDYNGIKIEDGAANIGHAQLDLGGSAKGYALDLIKPVLEEHGVSSALVAVGGSVLAWGEKPDGQPWRVGIRDPNGGAADYFATLDLVDACVSTSGIYERGFTENGVYYHHLLDPQTGLPVENGLASVTVVDENGARTDIYSTALFVMGPADGLAFANANGIDAVFVTREDGVLLTDGFGYDFSLQNPDYHLL